MRVGVVATGDAGDPGERSGTPYGVVTGLRALGVQVPVVQAAPPAVLERGVALLAGSTGPGGGSPAARLRRRGSRGLYSAPVAALRGRVGSRRVDRVPVDAWIQVGAGFDLRTDLPVAVYDDMTVRQAREHGYGHWAGLPRAVVDRRVAVQAAAYRAARVCCTESSWAAAGIETGYGVPRERLVVVGTGTSGTPAVVTTRDWSVPRFLFVGLDWRRKKGERVLRAFERVRAQLPAATLDVVGGHPPLDQPGVTGHGVLGHTEGDRARLADLFTRSTCFVMPSLFEPAGIVFTEAAAAGLPSVGGSVGGSVDLIGDAGRVVDPTDDDAVAAAMLELADPAVAAALGAAALDRAGLFTWRAVAARLLDALGLAAPDGTPVTRLPYRVPVGDPRG
jgi:glycosyltransferase involved in cell wall biosynthesis